VCLLEATSDTQTTRHIYGQEWTPCVSALPNRFLVLSIRPKEVDGGIAAPVKRTRPGLLYPDSGSCSIERRRLLCPISIARVARLRFSGRAGRRP
jgi:hypothetical protein